MKYNFWIFLLTFFMLTCGYGAGFQSLQLGADGRSSGMGMIATPLITETGGYLNPALLPKLPGSQFIFSSLMWIDDVQTHFAGISKSNHLHGFGFHMLYTDIGNIEHRLVASPEPIGTFSSHEFIAGFSYGRQIRPSLTVGTTVHALYEKLFVDDTWGLSMDMGILWQKSDSAPVVSAVIRHIGTTKKMKNESIKLPLSFSTGAAFPVIIGNSRCIAAFDLVTVQDDGFHIHTGLEYQIARQLFLRGGYQTGYELRSFTGGVGIAWHIYRFDYAYIALGADFDDSHRISLAIIL